MEISVRQNMAVATAFVFVVAKQLFFIKSPIYLYIISY